MMKIFVNIILIKFLFLASAYAKLDIEEENFIKKIEATENVEKARLILKKEQLADIQIPMGDKYKKRIFKYWKTNEKTVWILNSIGKYKPITAAFSVKECKIISAHVLIYREQHGYEIKYPSFLSQFNNLKINNKFRLTGNIDNISGATLSVNSMDRMARTALILDNISNDNKC